MKIHITTFATYKTDTNVLLFFSGTIDFPWAKSHIERKIRNRLPLFLHTLYLAHKAANRLYYHSPNQYYTNFYLSLFTLQSIKSGYI